MPDPTIAILIPVLDRPHRAEPIVVSIGESQTVPTVVMFLCTPGDTDEIAACRATGEIVVVTEWQGGQGDYARKINLGATMAIDAGADWIFTGADDLAFTRGWDEAALKAAGRHDDVVVGTVDDCNRRTRRARHSTHSLVSAAYVERGTIDEPGLVYHPGYWHNFCDDELVQTARLRGRYRPSDAVVEHLHPDGGKVDTDRVYALGGAHFRDDQRMFRRRSNLWVNRPPREPRNRPPKRHDPDRSRVDPPTSGSTVADAREYDRSGRVRLSDKIRDRHQ